MCLKARCEKDGCLFNKGFAIPFFPLSKDEKKVNYLMTDRLLITFIGAKCLLKLELKWCWLEVIVFMKGQGFEFVTFQVNFGQVSCGF